MIRLFALLLVTGIAFASDQVHAQSGADCNEGSNAQMTDCVANAYARADARLNRTWKQVMATLRDNDDATNAMREGLVRAQRAWIAFRDADCEGSVGSQWYRRLGAEVGRTCVP